MGDPAFVHGHGIGKTNLTVIILRRLLRVFPAQ